jgi:phosphohistidine phosphatase
MKTLLLIRHAKSSWENFAVTDEERPLNARGKKNAPEMAKRLRKKHITIDAFLSSPAKRARDTAEYFTDAYDVPAKSIIIVPELYMANAEAFTAAIRNAPRKADTIAVFSHNDGITQYANRLSDARVDNMPTCAVFGVKCNIRDWSEFEPRDNEFYFFDYPKSE